MKQTLSIVLLFFTVAVWARVEINTFTRPIGLDRFYKILGNDRIAGGVESEPHSRPFQAAVFSRLGDVTILCGGSLLNQNYVLTAAHCLKNAENTASSINIVLGAHKIAGDPNSITVTSTSFVTYPGWNPETLQNDLGLIKLPFPVTLNNYIQPISLPPYSAVGSSFSGTPATVSGWGKPSDDAESGSDVLLELTADVISNTACNIRYLGNIQPTQVCLDGADGKGGCSGDSGSPLTAYYKGKLVQIGIVSFGIPLGCEAGWPTVFARVTSYLDWISATTGIQIQP